MSKFLTTEYHHGEVETTREEVKCLESRGFLTRKEAYLLLLCVVEGIPLEMIAEEDEEHEQHLVYDIARAKHKLQVGQNILENESS